MVEIMVCEKREGGFEDEVVGVRLSAAMGWRRRGFEQDVREGERRGLL